MIKLGDLGKEVYYIDPKVKVVKEGIISGVNIAQSGYSLISIFCEDGTAQLENKHVHRTKDAAEQRLIEINPLLASADIEIENAKEKVDKIRLEVIGEPEFTELALKIVGSK